MVETQQPEEFQRPYTPPRDRIKKRDMARAGAGLAMRAASRVTSAVVGGLASVVGGGIGYMFGGRSRPKEEEEPTRGPN